MGEMERLDLESAACEIRLTGLERDEFDPKVAVAPGASAPRPI